MIPEIIGNSPVVGKLRRSLSALGAGQSPLVIVGEMGVGKSLFAGHVHHHSAYGETLVAMNASTLDERDQRILILGGEPAMLTTTRRSILERPTTVLLKHVDCLRPHLQDDLAEALLSRRIRRPGSSVLRVVSGRVILTFRQSPAALHRVGRLTNHLVRAIRSFKHLTIPPLRKRTVDILPLALHFLRQLSSQKDAASLPAAGRGGVRGLAHNGRLEPSLVSVLTHHRWEGNVMQLKVFMRSLVVPPYRDLLESREYQEVASMITNVEEGREFSLEAAMARVEQTFIKRAIERCGGNIRQAGQLLGITESAMHRRKSLLTVVLISFSPDSLAIDLLQIFSMI